jgi:hypothetical protein
VKTTKRIGSQDSDAGSSVWHPIVCIGACCSQRLRNERCAWRDEAELEQMRTCCSAIASTNVCAVGIMLV